MTSGRHDVVEQPAYFAVSSRLKANAQAVWEHAATFAGINRELWPLAHMTHPVGQGRLSIQNIPLGRRVFRSWILLFGWVPIEFDDLTFVEFRPGQGFVEESQLFSMRHWRHKRSILERPQGCELRDELWMTPRWQCASPIIFRVFQWTFQYRHLNLRRAFGGTAG